MTNQARRNGPSRPALRLLSLGAGVQSTAVLLLACEGVIPRFDYAVLWVNPQVLVAVLGGSG